MPTTATVSVLPTCDFCKHPSTPPKHKQAARFDFKTSDGPWAYGCPRHFKQWRFYTLLGTGRGQLLLLEGEDEAEVMAQVAPQVT